MVHPSPSKALATGPRWLVAKWGRVGVIWCRLTLSVDPFESETAEVRSMRRWFPVLALVVSTLWVAVMAALISGGSDRVVQAGFDRAALATLAVHFIGGFWPWLARPKPPAGSVPGWVLVQASKHRRKGVYVAAWGLLILGLGWVASRLDEPPRAYPGGASWFGVGWNLGFQPVVFVVEGLGIAAQSRLSRFVPDPKLPESAESHEL